MHWLDLILLAMLAIGAGLGFWSGLIMQVARLLCFGVSIYLTVLLNDQTTHLLHTHVVTDVNILLLRGIAYVAVFLAVYIGLFALSRLLYRVVRATRLEILDRLAGAALGAAKMVLILAPICAFLAVLSLPTTDEWMSKATVAPALARGMQIAMVLVPEAYKDQAKESVDHVRDRLQREALDKAIDLIKIEDTLKKK